MTAWVVLGVDPGSTVTGWGVVADGGGKLTCLANGGIRTTPDQPLPQRLLLIFQGLITVIEQYRPDEAAVEEVFVSHNLQSALKLGHARGAALTAIGHCRLPVHEYSALQIKKGVVGFGRAEKEQVQEMVRILLNLPKIAPKDASDAMAVAIFHHYHRPNLAMLAKQAAAEAARP